MTNTRTLRRSQAGSLFAAAAPGGTQDADAAGRLLPRARALRAAEGDRVAHGGLETRVVARPEQLDGAFLTMFEHDLAPRALGAPVHVHSREDEITHVVAGVLGVELDGEVLLAGPGDTVAKPRRVPHAFWNAGDEPLRLLEVVTPPGLERLLADLAPVLRRGGVPDLARIQAIERRYGVQTDLRSVERLVAEHGLVAPRG
jgi:mannose-6-phosphate isomerase-like protein (cupin superfamily)